MSTPVLVVDATGRLCPLPVIELAKHIADVAVGEVVEVVSDDPAAATDIPAWCRLKEHEFVGSPARDDATGYLVRRLH